jgi:hypothetical protein
MLKERKFIVMVIYNCELKNSDSFITISNSLSAANEQGVLFIYDNSPVKQEISYNESIWEKIDYFHDSSNPGLGIAYNRAAIEGRKNNFDWMLILDQDTIFDIDFISKLNIAMDNYIGKLYVPILKLKSGKPFSPTKYRYKRGTSIRVNPGEYTLDKLSPVNSGMYINIDVFNKVGGYNPKIKLDFADFQFIEKFKIVHNKLVVIDSIAYQDFSNDENNFDKSFRRFKLYIDGALNCYKDGITDKFLYLYSVFRHTVGLSLKFKTNKFLLFFFKEYFK